MNKKPTDALTIFTREGLISAAVTTATFGVWHGWPDARTELFPVAALLLAGAAVLLWPKLEKYIQELRETTEEAEKKRVALGMPPILIPILFLIMFSAETAPNIERMSRIMTIKLVGSFLTIGLLFPLLRGSINWIRHKTSPQPREKQQ